MEKQIELYIHYFLCDDGLHAINAVVYNECERNLIQSIASLRKYIGADIEINVSSISDGGVKSKYLIKFGGKVIPGAALLIIGAWGNNFFRPQIHKTEEIINRIEIIEKIKSGNFTQEEYDFIVARDKELMKIKSNFYKSALKEDAISKIESRISNDGSVATIEHSDFIGNVIDKQETKEIKELPDAIIYIVAPIIVKIPNSKLKWRGIYEGVPIEFSVKDSEFLKQVEEKDVSFAHGTSIKCNLEITIHTKYNEVGDELKEYSYAVTDVMQWEDDLNFVYETKKSKRIKAKKMAASSTMLLFDAKEFERT